MLVCNPFGRVFTMSNNNNKLFNLVSELTLLLWGWGSNTQFVNNKTNKTNKKHCALLYSPDREVREEGEATINMWLQAGVARRISEIWRGECYPFPADIGGGRTLETEAAADAATEPLREYVEQIEFLTRELVKGA